MTPLFPWLHTSWGIAATVLVLVCAVLIPLMPRQEGDR